MKKNIRFCFRISEKAGFAEDENGNPEEAFICCKAKGVEKYVFPKEVYNKVQEGYREYLANKLECDIEFIEPITLNEYLDNTDDCEEDEE